MNGAQALVKSLADEGVEVIFGLPGIQIMSIFDALFHEQSRIKLVTVRHEQAATYMADGYARTTGKVGVALVVPGPGALNALAGLGTAFASSSPVFLISGQIPRRYLSSGKGTLHEVDDQQDVIRPLTKWCAIATSPDQLSTLVHEAMVRLRTGRPRPVELEVPLDVLTSPLTQGKSQVLTKFKAEKESKLSPTIVRKAARILSSARRPLIWAGGGVIASNASDDLQKFAEMIGAPVVTTPEGKGSLPENHPLSLGAIYHDYGPARTLQEADVIIAVGSRLFLEPWGLKIADNQKLVQIDIDPDEVGRNNNIDLGIVSDARIALRALISELEKTRRILPENKWNSKELDKIRDRARNEIEQRAPLQLKILSTMSDELRDDAIVVSGITNVGHWSAVAFKVLRPRTYITASYFGTLGFAFDTALGAKMGNRDKQVVALCGDGGFLYSVQELITAVQNKLNVVTLVFNDSAYGASLFDQVRGFDSRIFGTRLKNPDFVKLAQSFGAVGNSLGSPDELGDALKKALKSGKTTVIEVPMRTLDPPFRKMK